MEAWARGGGIGCLEVEVEVAYRVAAAAAAAAAAASSLSRVWLLVMLWACLCASSGC